MGTGVKRHWWYDRNRSHVDQLVPRTLDELLELLAENGCQPPATARSRLGEALDWFRAHVPISVLAGPVGRFPAPAYAHTVRGVRITLLAWLQSIDWNRPQEVVKHTLQKGDRLVTFRFPSHEQPRRPRGNFFALPSVRSADDHGIIPSRSWAVQHGGGREQQTTRSEWVVTALCPALKSRIADALVSWLAKQPPGVASQVPESWYARGGAVQLFIWDAAKYIRKKD